MDHARDNLTKMTSNPADTSDPILVPKCETELCHRERDFTFENLVEHCKNKVQPLWSVSPRLKVITYTFHKNGYMPPDLPKLLWAFSVFRTPEGNVQKHLYASNLGQKKGMVAARKWCFCRYYLRERKTENPPK